MPAYYRISIEGTLGASPEVWSTGFAVSATPSIPTQTAVDTWASAAMTLLSSSDPGSVWLKANLGSTSAIQRVRIYYYPNVGGAAALMAVSTGAAAAGTGVVTHPPQCTTVVSLRTATPGASYRGRMYIPSLVATIGSALKRTDLSTSTAVNWAATLASIAGTASAGLGDDVAIVSQTTGAVTPVTQVRIGDVIDTQRRRRDNLVEQYYSATI